MFDAAVRVTGLAFRAQHAARRTGLRFFEIRDAWHVRFWACRAIRLGGDSHV